LKIESMVLIMQLISFIAQGQMVYTDQELHNNSTVYLAVTGGAPMGAWQDRIAH
jgi:hypothetical protein